MRGTAASLAAGAGVGVGDCSSDSGTVAGSEGAGVVGAGVAGAAGGAMVGAGVGAAVVAAGVASAVAALEVAVGLPYASSPVRSVRPAHAASSGSAITAQAMDLRCIDFLLGSRGARTVRARAARRQAYQLASS